MAKVLKRMLTSEETAYFCYQLAVILDSGVPVYDGLTVFAAESREESSPEANALLEAVINSLSMENPLYKALEETGVFPAYCVKTVMAGELSGRLFEALTELSEYYENESEITENIRSAVVSPMIMLVIAAAVISVLTIKILPMFAEIFSDFDPEIYDSVSRSVHLSASAGTAMLIICGITLLLSAVMYAIWSKGGSGFAGAFAAKFPITKKASEAAALAKFTGAVSMMISSGLTAAEALQNVRDISSNPSVNRKISECAQLVMEDVPFSDALEKTSLLPVFYTQTLKVSYSSGSFDTAWKKISRKLNDEAQLRINSIISGVEPALTAVMTIAAGVIMLTVMLPLMNIMTAL